MNSVYRYEPYQHGRRKKREKQRKNLEIRRRSPSAIPIHRRLSDTTDEMSPPPHLRRRGLSIVSDFSSSRLRNRAGRRKQGFFFSREEKK
ncbi:hypothetical protein BHE74_00051333 [Ensete ventricosum]|nr:hypothetical protein BHE74_00051333 [Ensete ventricosum]